MTVWCSAVRVCSAGGGVRAKMLCMTSEQQRWHMQPVLVTQPSVSAHDRQTVVTGGSGGEEANH